jgi:hypothetical protein
MYLDAKSLAMASRVCKVFKIIADQEILWMQLVNREGRKQTKGNLLVFCLTI